MSTSKIFLNYTDWHDVDEDATTTAFQGRDWASSTGAGNTCRTMSTLSSNVASSDIRN